MNTAERLWLLAGAYLLAAAAFGAVQALHNRRFGMAHPDSATWWFVGLFWYPILIWVGLTRLLGAARPRPSSFEIVTATARYRRLRPSSAWVKRVSDGADNALVDYLEAEFRKYDSTRDGA